MQKMTAYRRAAVALHELHEEDRQWLLAALPGEERSAVMQCLDELNALGFARAASPQQGVSLSNVFAAQPKKPVDRIRQASAAQVFTVLEHEPSSLIAQVMAMQDWPWAPAFLQMFSPMRRERIRAVLSGTAEPAPARRQFLIDALADSLKKQSAGPASPPAAKTWLRARVRALFPFVHLPGIWKR